MDAPVFVLVAWQPNGLARNCGSDVQGVNELLYVQLTATQ